VHSRAALYARTLRYLDSVGWRGPILVSDHSPAEHAGAIAEATRRHPALEIRLLRHAPDLHFLGRLADCARQAATPYVHLHADDDFIVPATLDKLVDLMQRKPACSAAMGINLHAQFENGRITVLPKRALTQAAAFDRLIAQLEAYSSVLYALRRRDEMAATFSFTVERCPDVQFWQYLESCVAALRGPVETLDELHYVRGVHEKKWSNLLVQERSPEHFPYLILSPAFPQRLGAFRAALIEASASAGAATDEPRLDAGLIHLLARGLRAMGLPERTAAGPEPADAIAKATLARLQDLRDPAGAELQRVFRFVSG
jgi:glycosyltransferase domain-containing protein